jgi:internalin A
MIERRLQVKRVRPMFDKCLNFEYHYPILPAGLLPRFIVRTHRFSEGPPAYRWRTGVILGFEGCRALVNADLQRGVVRVQIEGGKDERRRLLAIIRWEFQQNAIRMVIRP